MKDSKLFKFYSSIQNRMFGKKIISSILGIQIQFVSILNSQISDDLDMIDKRANVSVRFA